MITLEDAWAWYTRTRSTLLLAQRLARRHWGEISGLEALGRDEKVARHKGDDLSEAATAGLEPLNDLAVLVLFSVFEATVRDAVRVEVEREGDHLRHPALIQSLQETLIRIDEGSFFRVLEPFKAIDPDLVEHVNQVRRYRNWVAHGRRPTRQPDRVNPETAYDRLSGFLDLLKQQSIAPETEERRPPDETGSSEVSSSPEGR